MPAPVIEPGTLVDHYRVLRLLGQGAMGQVYLARDTRLGRKVALKLIRDADDSSPGARKQFLFEAKATAAFSHPHIVTVFGVGEVDGWPYVALEYLEGQTLRERIDEQPPSLAEALRVATAIADAMREAHAAGIVHRDLKPQNILLPRDGRLRVVDFGLARRVGELPADKTSPFGDTGEVTTSRSFGEGLGTPGYMAPEQWRGRAITAAVDVWALGMLLHELTLGRRPYRHITSVAELQMLVTSDDPMPIGEGARNLPATLRELIEQCLFKDPQQRPTAAEAHARLEALQGGRRAAGGDESPFRGLLPFTERHSGAFFGRDNEVASFVERLRHETILPVVGPSGAGKSSFVLAGVVPRLREQAAWSVIALRPGAEPFHTLATRLLSEPHFDVSRTSADVRDVDEPTEPASRLARAELEGKLAREPRLLGMLLAERAEKARARVLLFVDQLEELYTHVADDGVRRRFMEALTRAADDEAEPVRVCFSLRDDFLVRLAEGEGVAEALSRVFVLRSPGPEALRQILERPLAQAGYSWEDPALVTEILDEVKGEPTCLPLLGFATRSLWEQRDRGKRVLTRAACVAMGGVAGALASHADGLLSGLTPAETHLVRALLLRLVTANRTRRVVSRARLLEGLAPGAETLLGRLITGRLLSVRKPRPGERADPEVELAHESLLTTWGTLARWIEEGREEITLLGQMGEAAALWIQRGRRDEEVWRGETLAEARRALGKVSARIPGEITEFLRAGERLEARGLRRRRRLAVVGVAALALVALGTTIATLVISEKEKVAQADRQQARRRSAEAEREAARAALARGDLLAARARLRVALEIHDDPSARGLWRTMRADPTIWRRDLRLGVRRVAFGDGVIAAGLGDDTVVLLDRTTSAVRPLFGAPEQVLTLAFARDGKTLALGAIDGGVEVWDAAAQTRRFELAGHTGSVLSLAFSPDGRMLASGGNDLKVRLWNLGGAATPNARVLDGWTAGISHLVFSADGALLAATSYDGSTRLIDVASASVRHTLVRAAAPKGVDFTPDGATLVTGHVDGTIAFWQVSSGELAGEHAGNAGAIQDLAVSPGGQLLAFAGLDKAEIVVWDLPTRSPVARLAAHGRIEDLDFASDGRHLVSAGFVDGVHLHDTARAAIARPRSGHEGGAVNALVVAPDGQSLYSAGDDGTVRQWDLAGGAQRRALHISEQNVLGVALGPGGDELVVAVADHTVRLLDAASGVQRRILYGHKNLIRDLVVADAPLFLTASGDRTARLWELPDGRELGVLVGHGDGLAGAALTRDGKLAATGCFDHSIRLWDVAARRMVRELTGHTDEVHALAFTPDGRTLVSGGHDRTLRVWDVETGAGRELLRVGARVNRVAMSPDGARVAAAGVDGTRVLRLEDGAVITWIQGQPANDVTFTVDGQQVATAGDGGTVRLWSATDGAPVWRGPPVRPLDADALAKLAVPDVRDVTSFVVGEGGLIALGSRHGRLSVVGAPVAFVDPETAAVTRLALGPARTLIAGHADGAVGVWDTETGARLDASHIHGPIAEIVPEGDAFRVTSELGDVLRLDLSVLARPYCDVMNEVWREVPVVLENGHPTPRPPARDHPCVAK